MGNKPEARLACTLMDGTPLEEVNGFPLGNKGGLQKTKRISHFGSLEGFSPGGVAYTCAGAYVPHISLSVVQVLNSLESGIRKQAVLQAFPSTS